MRWLDHRLIARKFRQKVRKFNPPDLILTAMPSYDLAYEAVLYGNQNNVPVVVDIRDQWPDLFLDNIPRSLKKVARLFLFREFQLLERTLKGADALLSMMNVLLEWGLRRAGRQSTWKDKVFYLGYKQSTTSTEKQNKIEILRKTLDNNFVVTFIGTFGSYHDPSILVQVARRLKNQPICFVLAGTGEYFEKVKNEAMGLENVTLTGWLDQSEIDALLKLSHVGICPSTRYANFFPNKSFLYLSEGMPVVSSFQGDLKELIEQESIGLYYQPNDDKGLADCIQMLSLDTSYYQKLSSNAKAVFNKKFDSDQIYDTYARHLERLIAR